MSFAECKFLKWPLKLHWHLHLTHDNVLYLTIINLLVWSELPISITIINIPSKHCIRVWVVISSIFQLEHLTCYCNIFLPLNAFVCIWFCWALTIGSQSHLLAMHVNDVQCYWCPFFIVLMCSNANFCWHITKNCQILITLLHWGRTYQR